MLRCKQKEQKEGAEGGGIRRGQKEGAEGRGRRRAEGGGRRRGRRDRAEGQGRGRERETYQLSTVVAGKVSICHGNKAPERLLLRHVHEQD